MTSIITDNVPEKTPIVSKVTEKVPVVTNNADNVQVATALLVQHVDGSNEDLLKIPGSTANKDTHFTLDSGSSFPILVRSQDYEQLKGDIDIDTSCYVNCNLVGPSGEKLIPKMTGHYKKGLFLGDINDDERLEVPPGNIIAIDNLSSAFLIGKPILHQLNAALFFPKVGPSAAIFNNKKIIKAQSVCLDDLMTNKVCTILPRSGVQIKLIADNVLYKHNPIVPVIPRNLENKIILDDAIILDKSKDCLLYTSPSPRD